MYKNNSRDSGKFKHCSPLQLSCNLIGNRPQYGNFSYRHTFRHIDYVDSSNSAKADQRAYPTLSEADILSSLFIYTNLKSLVERNIPDA
jgi:hypothetical protein